MSPRASGPRGVSEHDFLHVRDAMRRARAIAATGEHAVRNRAQAIARLVPGEKHPQITDALEGRSVAGLSGKERKVVEALAARLRRDAPRRARAGLVGPKFKEFGYSRAAPSPSSSRPAAAGGRAARNSNPPRPAPTASRTRTSAAPGDDIYTENAALAYYLRGRDSVVKLGRKKVIDALHDVGRRWHPGADAEGRRGDLQVRAAEDARRRSRATSSRA
jgi:hypothetical protein